MEHRKVEKQTISFALLASYMFILVAGVCIGRMWNGTTSTQIEKEVSLSSETQIMSRADPRAQGWRGLTTSYEPTENEKKSFSLADGPNSDDFALHSPPDNTGSTEVAVSEPEVIKGKSVELDPKKRDEQNLCYHHQQCIHEKEEGACNTRFGSSCFWGDNAKCCCDNPYHQGGVSKALEFGCKSKVPGALAKLGNKLVQNVATGAAKIIEFTFKLVAWIQYGMKLIGFTPDAQKVGFGTEPSIELEFLLPNTGEGNWAGEWDEILNKGRAWLNEEKQKMTAAGKMSSTIMKGVFWVITKIFQMVQGLLSLITKGACWSGVAPWKLWLESKVSFPLPHVKAGLWTKSSVDAWTSPKCRACLEGDESNCSELSDDAELAEQQEAQKKLELEMEQMKHIQELRPEETG